MKLLYKLSKSALPCVLLTLCIGFCYSFSLFVPHIAEAIGCTVDAVRFTFCLNIFFLGMGAATFGPLVEKRIRLATAISSILLIMGLVLGGIACLVKSLPLLYLGLGVVAGISEGCGYIAPNKNMLLWFPTSRIKGVLSAISIFTFGLGSALCAWLFGILFPSLGIANFLFVLAAIYAVPSLFAAYVINKPKYALLKIDKTVKSSFSYLGTLKDSFFRKAWTFMFINISMGLVLIGSCASILKDMNLSTAAIVAAMMFCGIANGAGRLVFPAVGDILRNRLHILLGIVALEVLFMLPLAMCFCGPLPATIAAVALVLIHAEYGAAFSVLPGILSSHYGKDNLSQIHGFCLTSWGMASLMAFLCTSFALKFFDGFLPVMVLVLCGYIINIFIAYSMVFSKDKQHGHNNSDKN